MLPGRAQPAPERSAATSREWDPPVPIRPARLENVAAGVRYEEIRREVRKDLVRICRVDRIGLSASRIEHRTGARRLVTDLEPERRRAVRIAPAQMRRVTVVRLYDLEHLLVIAVLANFGLDLQQENRTVRP